MLQRVILLIIAAAMVAGGAWWMSRTAVRPQPAAPHVAPAPPAPTAPPSPKVPPSPAPKPSGASATPWVVAPGRVEPISEEMRLGFDMAGKIRDVLVEEGDRVRKGQVLATLAADELPARVEEAEQTLVAREAAFAKVVAGARHMEREEARAAVREARAILDVARVENERRRQLLGREVLSKEEADRAEREYKVARERLDAARQRFHLVDDPSRDEDVRRALAEVGVARAQVDEAKALAEKGLIRSPIDGVVLRKHRRAGEMVSVAFDTPVLTVGDVSRLRARVDVDERDIDRIAVGQKAILMAEAYGERRFIGHVSRVAGILGKKNIRTDEPAEKKDTRVLETLVDIDEDVPFPVGLRLDVFIITAPDGDKHLPAYRP